MPYSSRTSLNAANSPSGGVLKPPTPWIGSAIRQADVAGGGRGDQVAQVVDAGLDVRRRRGGPANGLR